MAINGANHHIQCQFDVNDHREQRLTQTNRSTDSNRQPNDLIYRAGVFAFNSRAVVVIILK